MSRSARRHARPSHPATPSNPPTPSNPATRTNPSQPRIIHVLGLGPAGRLFAYRAQQRGFQVHGWDPNGGSTPSTMGCWREQLPKWFPPALIASSTYPWLINSEGRTRQLTREYVMLSPQLRSLGDFPTTSRATSPSELAAHTALTDDTLIIDTRPPQDPLAVRQVASGIILPEDALPPPERFAILMDFRPIPDSPAPTFHYRMPLGDGTWLLEETILAIPEPLPVDLPQQLTEALHRRLHQLGIDPSQALSADHVDFPLGPKRIPKDPPGTLSFGARAGYLHPATGYSIGMSLSSIDATLDTALSSTPRTVGNPVLLHFLRRRGLDVLLSLNPTLLRVFFDTFFDLPEHHIFGYLTGNLRTTTASMLRFITKLAAEPRNRFKREILYTALSLGAYSTRS